MPQGKYHFGAVLELKFKDISRVLQFTVVISLIHEASVLGTEFVKFPHQNSDVHVKDET